MELLKDLVLSVENPFIIRETDLGLLHNNPFRLHGGAILFCTQGRAKVSVNTEQFEVCSNAQLILLPDTVFLINEADSEFRTIFFYFTRQLFEDAHRQFDPSFFEYLKNYPLYTHSPASANLVRQHFSLILASYADMANRYRTAIIANYLRVFLLNLSDKIQRNVVEAPQTEYTRKEELFHRFIELILGNCTVHRDVEFYADKLCITKRYLAAVTNATTGHTPKSTIDRHVIQEVKTLLVYSGMSLQEIADYLHFPDPSYLGRYFKRYVGMSLQEYRSNINGS